MKRTTLKNKSVNILLSVFLVIIFSFSVSAQRAKFLTSTIVPAARGYVDIHTDHNNNYVIKVNVSDLAEVKRLVPSKQAYVVWMTTEQTVTKNIGLINSSKGFIIKKLKASLETVSPHKPIKIFITTEYDPGVQYPSDEIVLSTKNIW